MKVIARTVIDESAIQAFQSTKSDLFNENEHIHKFYTVAMPMSESLLSEFCMCFRAVISYDFRSLVVTSNIDGWHEIAQKLSLSEDDRVRRFVPVLVQSFPEIFTSLKRSLKSDGTLAIKRYS